jgi:hypothetical protein
LNAQSLLIVLSKRWQATFQPKLSVAQLDEARRRINEMESGAVTLISAEQALAEVRRMTKAGWPSIDASERDSAREAMQRDEDLSSDAVACRTHEEVMEAARRAIGCV